MPNRRTRRFLALCGGLLVTLGAVAVWKIAPAIRAARGGQPPVIDRVPPELPAHLGPFAILLFSKTSGFRHEAAIPACEASVRRIAAARGWSVFATENAAVFDDAQLARFRVLVSNNATGDNWTPEQKAALQRFLLGGGGFVGVHGAAGTRYRFWDWYTDDLLRGRFVAHPLFPQLQTARVVIEDRTHPATAHLGESWLHEDEWYSFERSARGPGVRVLASLDESSYRAREGLRDIAMGDHPIVWSHCLGQGRVFY
ncbi:MAG: ThuA domain-containing protein, partial [Myxococcota bacterium]